jgi:hypothetical protein
MNGNHSRTAVAIAAVLALTTILPGALSASSSAKIDANFDAELANFA